jgi:hypothetical protein
MHTATTPGAIRADVAYTLQELERRLGLGAWAMRQARRHGLKVRRVGRRGFVLGRDAIEYLERAAT